MGKLDQICPTSGVGPFLKGGAVHEKSAYPHRVCGKSPQRPLWRRKAGLDWKSCWRSHGCWTGGSVGLWGNITKVTGSKKLLQRLSQIYNRWPKEDPPTSKQLPVEADVPELLAEKGNQGPIPHCFLLPIAHWGIHDKGKTEQEQTVQFKYEDITFFKKNSSGQLQCLPQNAPAHLIANTDGITKGVCIYQEANGDNYLCPVKVLGQRFLHLQLHGSTGKTFLSSYWAKGIQADVTVEHID